MAIITSPTDSRLRLMVQTGTDPQGNPVVATRNYSRIRPRPPMKSVYQVATVLGGLQSIQFCNQPC